MNYTTLQINGLKITLASIEEQLQKLRQKIKEERNSTYYECLYKETQEWRKEVIHELSCELEIKDIIESV